MFVGDPAADGIPSSLFKKLPSWRSTILLLVVLVLINLSLLSVYLEPGNTEQLRQRASAAGSGMKTLNIPSVQDILRPAGRLSIPADLLFTPDKSHSKQTIERPINTDADLEAALSVHNRDSLRGWDPHDENRKYAPVILTKPKLGNYRERIALRMVERDEVMLLDWLNGELHAKPEETWFGGSLTHEPEFDAVAAYKRIIKYAQSLPDVYNHLNFVEMARRARALYILLRISIQDAAPEILANEGGSNKLREMKAFSNVEVTIASMTRTLFPWLTPTYSSILDLHASFREQEEWGIVTTGGNKHFYLLQHLILSLRTLHKVTLPIQIFYAGDTDLDPSRVLLLEQLPNVTCHNLLQAFPPGSVTQAGWSLKPIALVAARGRRVLFLDADVALLQDPLAAVLRHPAFVRTGTLFFRDRRLWEEAYAGGGVLLRDMNAYLSAYARGLPYVRGGDAGRAEAVYMQDSGVVAVDKGRLGVLMGLLLAVKMNSEEERENVFYTVTLGDKESFWFAMETLRVPYAFNQAGGGVMGEHVRQDEANSDLKVACGPGLLQLDSDMKPFFFNGGVIRNRLARPAEFDFVPYGVVGKDVTGDGHWVRSDCLRGTEENVRPLNEMEVKVMEDLKVLFGMVNEY
ncbi:mannosyltransferase putative-domain-containing protein [Chytriomyces sp. MP71]|nr:mannosyltransferase putative-domain-containing protein [Chytriomyces sp. MP71]